METNRLLAALGNNLNQIRHHLTPGSTLHHHVRRLLQDVEEALDLVDVTGSSLSRR